MIEHPRTSLGRVLDNLGTTMLDLVAGEVNLTSEISGVVIHDPLDEPVYPERTLVLGVGLHAIEDIAALLGQLSAAAVSALIVRGPLTPDDRLRAAVNGSNVTVLALARGVTWAQLATLLRTILSEGDIGAESHESLGGLPSGDLFAVANAISALIDAPVTIEDRSSRVLAFSGRQEEADASRAETIVGRQVPERFARRLTEHGIFRDLYRNDAPVVIDPGILRDYGITTQRVAIAVRAGDEVLGSIWAAMDGSVTAELTASLTEAAKLAALHLLRVRAGADVQRRLTDDLVSIALSGTAGASDALRRLRLVGRRMLVLGAYPLPEPSDRQQTRTYQEVLADGQRMADAFAVHLSARSPGAVAAQVGDVTYGIISVFGEDAPAVERARQIAADFVDRVGVRLPTVVGVGEVGHGTAGIARSRATVDRVLRILREERGTRSVACLDDVFAASLMADLGELARSRDDRISGTMARLIEYDRAHESKLLETLSAWVDHFGDVTAAASALFLHPNTFRYRLRRVAEVGQLDLDDPEHRFAMMLELRVLPFLSGG